MKTQNKLVRQLSTGILSTYMNFEHKVYLLFSQCPDNQVSILPPPVVVILTTMKKRRSSPTSSLLRQLKVSIHNVSAVSSIISTHKAGKSAPSTPEQERKISQPPAATEKRRRYTVSGRLSSTFIKYAHSSMRIDFFLGKYQYPSKMRTSKTASTTCLLRKFLETPRPATFKWQLVNS